VAIPAGLHDDVVNPGAGTSSLSIIVFYPMAPVS